MRKILLLFITIFFLFSVFFYKHSSDVYDVKPRSDKNGIVLGESETALNEILNYEKYDLAVLESAEIKKEEKGNIFPVEKKNKTDFDLGSDLGALLDCKSGHVIFEDKDKEITPIASITKLVTVLTYLQTNPNLDDYYVIKKEDFVAGGKIYLKVGDIVKVRDLMNISLIASANSATMALVHSTNIELGKYIEMMKQFANNNDLGSMNFVDPIGLGSGNISTAVDVVKLANIAFSDELLSTIINKKSYKFSTKNNRTVVAYSTNTFLNKNIDNVTNIGGKTGFTNLAGYCFVGKFMDNNNNEVIAAVLNERNINSRFRKAKELASWGFENYTWEN